MPNAYTESLLSKSKFPMMQVGRARLKRRKNGLWILQHNTTQPDKFANLWDSLALIRSVLIDVTQALFWLYSDASIDLLCKTEEDSIAVSIIVDVLQRLSWQYQKSRSKQLLQRQHSLAKQERGSAERWVSRSRRKKKEGIVGKEGRGRPRLRIWMNRRTFCEQLRRRSAACGGTILQLSCYSSAHNPHPPALYHHHKQL